jgi:predicted NACHT family NTPase
MNYPKEDDDSNSDNDGDGEHTVGYEMDTLMTSVEECRQDMKKYTKKLEKSAQQHQSKNAAYLEEAIIQMNWTIGQVTLQEQGRLNAFKEEIQLDIQQARTAIGKLSVCLDRAEQGLNGLTEQMQRLGGTVDKIVTEFATLKLHVAGQDQLIAELRQQLQAGAPLLVPTVPIASHSSPSSALKTAGNYHKALSGSYDNTLRVWDLSTGQTLLTLEGHLNTVYCCEVFDQDRKALSGSYDKTLRVWDFSTGQTLSTLQEHSSAVRCCAVFDQDRKALSGSVDSTLRVWDLSTGQTLSTLQGHSNWVECCAVFDQDHKALSGSGDSTLHIWDLSTGQTLSTLKGHSYWVSCCAVFDQDRKALSGSDDKKLRVWDLSTGQTLLTLKGHSFWVRYCAVFDQDRKAVLTIHYAYGTCPRDKLCRH